MKLGINLYRAFSCLEIEGLTLIVVKSAINFNVSIVRCSKILALQTSNEDTAYSKAPLVQDELS